MRIFKVILTIIAGLSALLLVAACGDSQPEPTVTPVLSTPTAEPTAEATAVPTVTASEIEQFVRDSAPSSLSAADVGRIVDQLVASQSDQTGIRRPDLEKLVRDAFAEAEQETTLASDGPEDDNETSTPDVLFRYMNAVNQLYAGQADEAISAFDLIIRVHPDMARAYYYRGVAFYRAGFDEEALADLETAIDLDPESGEPYLQRGLIHYQNDDRQAAMRDFNSAIDLAPWLADAYRNRGVLFLNNGVVGPGVADLEQALRIYQFERKRDQVEELTALLDNPPNEPLQMLTSTDILPRLP